jgi:hypothetical protein
MLRGLAAGNLWFVNWDQHINKLSSGLNLNQLMLLQSNAI